VRRNLLRRLARATQRVNPSSAFPDGGTAGEQFQTVSALLDADDPRHLVHDPCQLRWITFVIGLIGLEMAGTNSEFHAVGIVIPSAIAAALMIGAVAA
jgi:hypothetical protein